MMARRARAVEPDPIPPRPTLLRPAGPLRVALSTVGSSRKDMRSPGGPEELAVPVRLEPPLNPRPVGPEGPPPCWGPVLCSNVRWTEQSLVWWLGSPPCNK